MVIVKGRSFRIGGTGQPPPPPPPPMQISGGTGDTKITITLSAPDPTATTIFEPLKEGKKGVFMMDHDDLPGIFKSVVAYLTGGVAPIDGITYPGKFSSDGCGNFNRAYTAAVGVNVKSGYNDSFSPGSGGRLAAADLDLCVAKKCYPVPHGYYHDFSFDPANFYTINGFNPSKNVSECVKYIWAETGYVPRYFISPNGEPNDPDYNPEAEKQGLLGNSSENITDGYHFFPNGIHQWGDRLGIVSEVDATFWAYLRDFTDQWSTPSVVDGFKQKIVGLKNFSATTPAFYRMGTHGPGDWAAWKGLIDYVETVSQDTLWVTTLNEFLEYLETKRNVVKQETLSGNVLTVTLNYSNIPVNNRCRDLSLLVNTTSAITSIVVSNADGSSSSLTNKRINVYNEKKYFDLPFDQPILDSELPITYRHIYQDNNLQPKPAPLIDNVKTDIGSWQPANTQANLVYYPHDVVFDVSEFKAEITRIIMYTGFANPAQTQVILVREDNDAEVNIGTYTGGSYNSSVIFTPLTIFRSKRVILRPTSGISFSAEVEIFANYQPYTERPLPFTPKPIGWQSGLNIHPWDLTDNTQGGAIHPQKYAAFKSLNLRSVRLYDDNYATQDINGDWRFNPELRGFAVDTAYTQLKIDQPWMVKWRCQQGQTLEVKSTWDVRDVNVYAVMTVTSYTNNNTWGYLQATVNSIQGSGTYNFWHIYKAGALFDKTDYSHTLAPDQVGLNWGWNVGGNLGYAVGDVLYFYKSQVSHINVLLQYNNARDTFAAWQYEAHRSFVYASRGGKNANVPNYPIAAGQTMLKGANIYDAGESGNEWNAFWKGYDGFMNGNQLFYAWSMNYDGHKGLYPLAGYKNADPTFRVMNGGLASDTLDIFWAVLNLSKKYRGYLPDGTPNLPFDILNVHCYSSAGGQYSGSQGGLPPEDGMFPQVRDLVWFSKRFCGNREVWISEWGWDVHPNSPLNATAYDVYNAQQVRAMWVIRGMLGFAMLGLSRAQFYRAYQEWPNTVYDNSATQFDTMSLLRQMDATASQVTRTMAGDYVRQFSEFADYVYDSTIPTGDPNVFCYKYTNLGSVIYAIWSLEITTMVANRPTFAQRTGNFNLPLANGTNIALKQFVDDGSGVLSTTPATVSGTFYTVAYAAKPKIIQFL